MTTDRQARLDRALEWQRNAGSGAPTVDDVEVVVRLGVVDLAVARELVLADGAAVLAQWEGLQQALDGQTPEPTSEPTSATTPEAAHPSLGSSLTGLARARFSALSSWIAAEVA